VFSVRTELKFYALFMFTIFGFLKVEIFVMIGASLYVGPGPTLIITVPSEAAGHDRYLKLVLPNTTHVPQSRAECCGSASRPAVGMSGICEDNARAQNSPPRLPSTGRSLRFDKGRDTRPNVGFPQSLQTHPGTVKGNVNL
jgi:hypothetical protein